MKFLDNVCIIVKRDPKCTSLWSNIYIEYRIICVACTFNFSFGQRNLKKTQSGILALRYEAMIEVG